MSFRFLPASRRNGFRPTISCHWLHTRENAGCWNKPSGNNNGSFSATTPIQLLPVSKRRKADCIFQSGKASRKPLYKPQPTDILTKYSFSAQEKKRKFIHFLPCFGLFLENTDQNKVPKSWFYPFSCLNLDSKPTNFKGKSRRKWMKSRHILLKTRREIQKRPYFFEKRDWESYFSSFF